MNIEQLHLDAIQADKYIRTQLSVNDCTPEYLEEAVAKSAAEVTKKVAIDFIIWIADKDYNELMGIEANNPIKDAEYLANRYFELFLKLN